MDKTKLIIIGGDQVIQASRLTLGKLQNSEDGALLFIGREDFKRLRQAIPVIDEHLDKTANPHIKNLLQQAPPTEYGPID